MTVNYHWFSPWLDANHRKNHYMRQRWTNSLMFTYVNGGLNWKLYMVYLTSTELYNISACIDSLSIWCREHSEKPAWAFCESQWSEKDIGPEWRKGTLRMKWQFFCGNVSAGSLIFVLLSEGTPVQVMMMYTFGIILFILLYMFPLYYIKMTS